MMRLTSASGTKPTWRDVDVPRARLAALLGLTDILLMEAASCHQPGCVCSRTPQAILERVALWVAGSDET